MFYWKKNLLDQAVEKGNYILNRLTELSAKHKSVLIGARGRGLMIGMEFANNELGYEVAKNLFARNILISGTYINAKVLRVEPPLVISREQIDQFLDALDQSLTQVERETKSVVASNK